MYTYTKASSSKQPLKTPPQPSLLAWCGSYVGPLARAGRDFCLWTSMHGLNHIAWPRRHWIESLSKLGPGVVWVLCESPGAGGEGLLSVNQHAGLNHIAWPRRHWIERLLWVLVTAAAIWGAVEISLGQLQRYNENPTVVTLEKDFRSWRFSLPSITVCESNRVKPSKLPAVIKDLWGVSPGDDKYEYYSEFVHTVANSELFHLEGFQRYQDDSTLDVDMLQLVQKVVPELAPSVMKPNWPTEEPPWTPVITEAGACYNTNSRTIQEVATVTLNPNDTKKFPLTCRYSSMTCAVMIEFFTTNFTFYIHSPYDVLDITNPPKTPVTLASTTESTLSVMETRSGKGVQELDPDRRACRYTFEPTSPNKKVYSTNTCRLSCRAKLAIELCGCKPFYYFYEEGPTCPPSGMSCLSLPPHRAALANFGGQRCSCVQQCVTSVFQETAFVEHVWGPGPFGNRGSVRFIIQAPRTRYTKEIVFHFQDLVVSFGGAAGLFLGASFISFVEVFYFILARMLTCCMAEDTKKEDSVKVQKLKVPYESIRINELNAILESQKRFEHGRHMKLYY